MRTIFRFPAQEDKCEVIIHVQLYAYGPAQHACDKLIFSLIDICSHLNVSIISVDRTLTNSNITMLYAVLLIS